METPHMPSCPTLISFHSSASDICFSHRWKSAVHLLKGLILCFNKNLPNVHETTTYWYIKTHPDETKENIITVSQIAYFCTKHLIFWAQKCVKCSHTEKNVEMQRTTHALKTWGNSNSFTMPYQVNRSDVIYCLRHCWQVLNLKLTA